MQNPYESPTSSLTNIPETQPRRPVSVWIFVLFFGVFGIVNTLTAARFLWSAAVYRNPVELVTTLALAVLMLGIAAGAVLGAFYRQQWGRWLAIVVLGAFALFSIFGHDSAHYASDAERLGGHLARYVLIPAVLAWWCYALGFSEKSKRYFA